MFRNALLLFLLCSNLFGFAGKLTEVTGPTQVSRASTKLEGKVDVGVEMNDTVETLKARAGITFEDGTRVQCTEFSKLIIDEFVYDPNSGKGKLGLKASMGTVRYASGLIAKNSREEVKVKTPTASISVRGTDFSMTVDELGRSLVILLPSLPQFGPPVVGSIVVDNGLGQVVLNKAYQATLVSSTISPPSSPVLLNFEDETKVNNMLLVDTPKSVTQAAKEVKKVSVQAAAGDDDSKPTHNKVDTKPSTTTQTAVNKQPTEEDVTATTEQTVILDIAVIDPDISKKVMDAIETKVQAPTQSTNTSAPLVTIPTVLSNHGFTTDGTNAILYISNGKNVIWYMLKADTNAIFNITNKDGTTEYPLNYGGKLKVNIYQK